MDKTYRIKYTIKRGNFEPSSTMPVNSRVSVSNDGFTDDLFLISMLHCPHGHIDRGNVLILSSMSSATEGCSLEDLHLLRDLVTAEINRRKES